MAQARRMKLNLALQGGGAHGAFTWGVLDRLVEEPSIEIGWISGTSAGAVNAVALVCGLAEGGADGARETMRRVWTAVMDATTPDLVRRNPLLAVPWAGMKNSAALAHMATMFSPYDLNPLGIDPFRKLLQAHLDIDLLRRSDGPELLIAATDIATGRARLFRRAEITIDAVLASACLPMLSHAVEIDGRAYWDGGFSANPDLTTLAAESPVGDTLVVQLSPLVRFARPTSARDIAGHVSHLTFVRPYVAEIETILRLRQVCGASPDRRWYERLLPHAPARTSAAQRIAAHRFHLIDAGRFTANLAIDTQAKPEEVLITYLFNAGRSEAAKWLDRSLDAVGHRDTACFADRLAAGETALSDVAA